MMYPGGSSELVGASEAIGRLRSLVPLVAASDSGVLLIGEAGTGREHVARMIHAAGPRAGKPFAVVGCPGYAWQDGFDELFGGDGRPGVLEASAEGSVYLASIDELPLGVQGRLARYVEDAAHGEIQRAPRLIVSSRHDLQRWVHHGKFRGDLYYRLSVVSVRLPPLRDRREDIPLLAQHFLERTARSLGKEIGSIAPAAIEALVHYRWNGNLAELASAIERAAIIEPGSTLTAGSLPPPVVKETWALAS
jgi:DNA-binding NtrC family response regulator